MSVGEAMSYHLEQIATLAEAGADQICAITMTNPTEAAGISNAAAAVGLPAVIGFTTETDGRLPDGTTLPDAIEFVDSSADAAPAFYIINCAHVDHFSGALTDGEQWTSRIRGVRANASRLSHAELDECEELDDGDPQEFAELYQGLSERFPQMHLFGGCCGTDHRHIEAVCIVVA
jgi:S-methylmethionine-dependent homocysteine/selenocysteine methylase